MKKAPESRLQDLLGELKLSGIKDCYGEEADLTRKQSLSYERYLLELLGRESERRRENRVDRFLRESELPLEKTLTAFKRKRLPRKVDQQIAVLLDEDFGSFGCLVFCFVSCS